MAPRKGCAMSSFGCNTRAALAAEAASAHYQHSVLSAAKEATSLVEEEVRLAHACREDDEVDEQVGDIVPDLGCTRNRDTKFHRTVELYWHVKTMVATGMLPKEHDYKKLIQRLEDLEGQNKLLMSMVSWLVKRNGGTLQLVRSDGQSLEAGPSHSDVKVDAKQTKVALQFQNLDS
jgi:hypothetical protein